MVTHYMREERYFNRHAELYQRLLIISFVIMFALGIHSLATGGSQAKPGMVPHFDALGVANPPEPTTTKAVKVAQLPGSDGSAKDSQADPTPAVKPDANGNIVVVEEPVAPTRPAVVSEAPANLDSVRSLGREMNAAMFGEDDWPALNKLWTRESNWNVNARNASGACGIPQALPCSKIPDMSPQGQITWGLGYIKARYGTPQAAWAHSQSYGWY